MLGNQNHIAFVEAKKGHMHNVKILVFNEARFWCGKKVKVTTGRGLYITSSMYDDSMMTIKYLWKNVCLKCVFTRFCKIYIN